MGSFAKEPLKNRIFLYWNFVLKIKRVLPKTEFFPSVVLKLYAQYL